MKLYQPEAAESFVFAVVPMNAREGTAPEFKAVRAGDVESALNQLDAAKQRNAAPHCMGRYDHLGRYETYCPPVDGVKPGKFLLHPYAQKEYKESRPY
mgnify:CR=1 FL=1|tara:strand:- start:256 stop:549 length:294 start_codon:yes stop_codon:yes gene_type:complete